MEIVKPFKYLCWTAWCFLLGLPTLGALAQDNTARLKQVLDYVPLQSDVEIDIPNDDEIARCTLESNKTPPGVVVKDGSGRILRRFVDTTGNRKTNQLSYFKNGIEVYRELDTSGDGIPNEYRWFGPNGTRWGIDRNGNKKIDEWNTISAEELAKELFHAIRTKDADRFGALLLTPAEFKQLDLGDTIGKEIQQRWSRAKKDFTSFCNSQREIVETTEFVSASNGPSGLVAADAFDNPQDIKIYDHATLIFKNKEQFSSLSIGSMVQVNNRTWKLVELPELAVPGSPITNGGAFFPTPSSQVAATETVSSFDPKLAQIYEDLDELEKKISNASNPRQVATLEAQRADLLKKFVELSEPGEPQLNALMYATDSIVSAYQDQRFPDGLKVLENFLQNVTRNKQEGADYINWRMLTGRYNLVNLTGTNEERDKAHSTWIDDLTEFQKSFPASRFAPEALIYLGINNDNEGNEEDAIKWYREVVKRFPDTDYSTRARGALVRLEGQGKPFAFVGKDLKGNIFNLKDPRWRDKIVILHFWETWCADGLEQIQRLSEKYKEDVVFVSCNLEMETKTFEDFLKKNPEYGGWIHLHAPGSIESSELAHQLGIPSEPLLILVNKKGELEEPMVIFSELERQIERQRRR